MHTHVHTFAIPLTLSLSLKTTQLFNRKQTFEASASASAPGGRYHEAASHKSSQINAGMQCRRPQPNQTVTVLEKSLPTLCSLRPTIPFPNTLRPLGTPGLKQCLRRLLGGILRGTLTSHSANSLHTNAPVSPSGRPTHKLKPL